MWSAEAVVVCALALLTRGAASFPPIQLVDAPPPDVSANAEAYVRSGDRTIYLVTSTAAFQRARNAVERCSDRGADRRIASVIIHEEAHLRGADETGAYAAQLLTLTRLGAGPGDPEYVTVMRSMRSVLDKQRKR